MTGLATDVILALEAPSGRFYQKDGRPVWPVRTAKERESLEKMVSTLGGAVSFIDDAVEGALSGPELVVGLGVGAFEHARLYAHLTRRSCELVETREQLAEFPHAAVVVTTYAHVDERLLDLLYDRHPLTSAPGLIFSYDDADLSLQVLTRAAALHCRHDHFPHRRIDINPNIEFGAQMAPEFSIVGGEASPAEFRAALSGGAGLLTLYSHSDGIDAYLREGLVLCPMERADASEQPAPSCVVTGFCQRCSRPMSEVLGTDVLLHPRVIKAHVLVYCVCWGLYPSQNMYSPAYALSRRLLESFTVGALVTSWEINIQRLPLTARLFHDIARGLPLGEALARHLSSAEARGNYHKLCLIGDPALRLAPLAVADPLDSIQAFQKPPPPSQRSLAGLTLLRLMIHRGTPSELRPDAGATASATAAEYEAMLVDGRYYDAALAARFRRDMVDYLTSQDTMLSKCWSTFADTIEVLPAKAPCSVCGRRTIARAYVLRIAGCVPRREAVCPSCGSVEDSPIDRAMAMSVAPDGQMQLHGSLPRSDWHARITIERFYTRETDQWDWPAAATGEPVASFQVPQPWPLVPFRLSLIMVHGYSEFTVLGCLYRGTREPVVDSGDSA